MLIEIRYDLWVNTDYIVSVQIDGMPHFPVLITMDAPDEAGGAQTYRVPLQTWQHMRNWLKLYTRLPKSVDEPQDQQLPGAGNLKGLSTAQVVDEILNDEQTE